jgi:hypothetical protein
LGGSYWEFEVDGVKAAIVADGDAWPKVKQQRPDLEIITLQEVGIYYAHYRKTRLDRKTRLGAMTNAVKDSFPGAQVKSMSLPEEIEIDDPIPF